MDAVELYVERLAEPYTGMPLVGVGGYVRQSLPVRVWYGDEVAAVLTPTPQPDDRLHFSTQLPVEPTLTRVRVQVGDAIVYDRPLADIGDRPPLVERRTRFGVVGRGVRSVATGEVFSPTRWQARFGRLADYALRAKQKLRYKLLARRFRPRPPYDGYVESTAITPAARAAMAAATARFRRRPTFSVLLPVYNSDPALLAKAVESVFAQAYPHWQLCVSDDASTRTAHLKLLDRWAADSRVSVVRGPTNGHISANTNAAADLATGEFVVLLDHDDELAPDALFRYAELLTDHPDADLIYSDEDKLTPAGRRYDPQHKPQWSPELLLSYNYVNHLVCVRRTVFEKAGRFRVGYEGSQDHDLLLRVSELTDRVYHVPRVLYHWRATPASTATAAAVKGYVHTSGRKAVEDALTRRGIRASLYVPAFAERLNLPVLALDGPDDGPTVAVVVRGPADLAAQTMRAVRRTTAYRNYTPYLVTDDAPPADALNRLAAGRTEDYLLFLDAGTEPTEPRWLSRLLAYAAIPGVGACGGLVRNAEGTIVSAGVALNERDGTGPGPVCGGVPAYAVSYYFYAEAARNVAAPGGCVLTPRAVFERLGGFDADRFPTSLYAADYGTRVRGLGLRCVHVAGAELIERRAACVSGPVPHARVEARRASEPQSTPAREFPARGDSTGPLTQAARPGDDPLERAAFRHAYGRPADPFAPATDPPTAGGRLRTLVVAHNLNNPEGAPRYLSEIVLGLRDRGAIDPTTVSPLGGPGAAVYTSAGVPVELLDADWSRRFVDGRWTPREYEAAQRAIVRTIRTSRPDVLVANTLLTFPAVEAAARLGVPSVWVIHESYSREVLERLFPPFARHRIELAFRLAARVVPASHDTAALFDHLNVRGNVRVLHNGLNPAPFDAYRRRVSRDQAAAKLPGSEGKKRIVAVGTVCERKGQHTLVEAAAELAKTRDDFAVYLVGVRDEVPYAGYVRQLVRRRGLENVVRLIAETDDPFAFLRAADVFVCTSHLETFSRAVLEAEAFGLPVVSTRCHGLGEQVDWGFNALPFAAGDAGGLAAQLGRVLGDDRLRADMGRRSRAAFDAHLSDREMLDRYEAVIRAAAGPATGEPRRPAVARAA